MMPPSELERRLTPRLSCRLSGECVPLRQPWKVLPIRVQDISLGGIGFIARQSLGCGEEFRVQLRTPEREYAVTKVVRAKHVRIEKRDRHFHGCAFDEPLDESTVSWLLYEATLPEFAQSQIPSALDRPQPIRDILVVDECPETLAGLQLVLSAHGFTVHVAATADEALHLCMDYQLRAVVADLDFMKEDGPALVPTIQVLQPNAHLYLLGAGLPCHPDDLPNPGMVHCLSKPIALEQLVTTLGRVLVQPN